ncbi:hypothetical protein L1887_31609 [Cichorium endivia]|nr:hypothetical protein L1887_31609 [Cichorium endivia]
MSTIFPRFEQASLGSVFIHFFTETLPTKKSVTLTKESPSTNPETGKFQHPFADFDSTLSKVMGIIGIWELTKLDYNLRV